MTKEKSAEPGSKVVGIGASAGGLSALRHFLEATPGQSGLAFVVVVHLSPEHESFLSDLLQTHCNMPVLQVTDTTPLDPNRVYVIPPGRNISTIDTHLRLSPLEADRRLRAPIDHFFGTIAETHTVDAVGVILSGTGSDGAAGLRKIKHAGGLTIVQDPNEAEYDGMPQSAIATGLVDFILPVEEIPPHILRFIETKPRLAIPAGDEDESSALDQKAIRQLFGQLRTRTGQDFSRYKESTILRRIRRRMQLRQLEEFPDYLALLRESAEENQALADDLLITVTNFFRDAEVFQKLAQDVLPAIFAGKGPHDRVRIWSVGCATGEEAYSLAMLLLEYCDGREKLPDVQIFASELHQRSLLRARDGFYTEAIEHDIAPERLARFFTKLPGGYQVRKEVRSLVVFAAHNLLRDPPFSQIDLIACRNLMIYLKREVQEDVIRLFHYSLNPAGYLLLGSAETIERSELFRLVDKKQCLYTRRSIQRPEARIPVFPFVGSRLLNGSPVPSYPPLPVGVLHQRMLERYAPPSILLNQEHHIVHLSESAGGYLVQPGGEPTNNILRRIRSELQMELSRVLHELRGKREPVRSRPMSLLVEGKRRQIILRASAAADDRDGAGLLLVIFDDAATPASEAGTENGPAFLQRELGEELELSNKRFESLIEEYESGQEEMQASNEELQSTNEELRSTMEELETGKEELQSMNEELRTVNQENKNKVEELSQLSADLQNLLAATEIATLFLDRNLRILRFTPRVGTLFNIRDVDRGRPLADLTHRLGHSGLLEDAAQVLQSLVGIEREVQSEDGVWYLTRMLPYRAASDRISGVVLTFVDINRLKSAEQAREESDDRYRLLVENVLEYAIFVIDPQGQISTWNAGAQRLFGYHEADCIGRSFDLMYTAEDRSSDIPAREIEKALRDGQCSDDRCYVRRDGSTFWATGVLTPLRRQNGELRGFSKVMRDNSERRNAEAELESRNTELLRANRELEEFAYVASHDLQEPLRMVSIYSQLLLQFVDIENSDKAKRFAEFISSGAHRMQGLITDLLGYSRVLHEDIETVATADCGQALKEAEEVFKDQIRETEAIISNEALPVVFAEQRHISVLFRNLLSNALKYLKPGQKPRINISVKRQGKEWLLTFADNGIGFSPEYAERIFGLFKRLHKGSYPGTGLGLAICKQIIERNGGTIWAASEGEGCGAKFCMTLRAVPHDHAATQNLFS
jgi:two-component system CheB/CheR fusion protein